MTLWKKCELRTYSRVLALLLSMILLLSTGVFQPTASAEESQEVWNPDSYEIHLMLDSDLVLDENHLLKQEYLDLFEVDDSYKTFSLAYYETQERDFFQEGWINRLRLKYEEDAEKDFKLTYKKRYSVPENDLTAAVHLAETEGFDLLSGLWEPQIDWGYTGMTLSLSAEAAVPTGGKKTIADLNPEELCNSSGRIQHSVEIAPGLKKTKDMIYLKSLPIEEDTEQVNDESVDLFCSEEDMDKPF